VDTVELVVMQFTPLASGGWGDT